LPHRGPLFGAIETPDEGFAFPLAVLSSRRPRQPVLEIQFQNEKIEHAKQKVFLRMSNETAPVGTPAFAMIAAALLRKR
jgi:hypothetical protein